MNKETIAKLTKIETLTKAVQCAISTIEHDLLRGVGEDPKTEKNMILAFLTDALDFTKEAPMTTAETIAKLKDPKQAQPFGLLSDDERAILKSAGKANCYIYVICVEGGAWEASKNPLFSYCYAYILKPDYQSEPEYEDCEVEKTHSSYANLMARGGPLSGPTSIHKLPARPKFVGFFILGYGFNNRNVPVRLEEVANTIDEGHKVVARFRKD